jgi:hypothetical protein
MVYQDTIEESHFTQTTMAEKQSFANLINEKSKIIPTFEQV